jgi:hypothetical protein
MVFKTGQETIPRKENKKAKWGKYILVSDPF